MRIEVKARTFFEVRQGEKREKELMRTTRIISINNVSFPAEPPPFSEQFLTADNLLILYFDDVDDGENAMTPEQAKAIVDFVCTDDSRPLIVHCTAGISRSGAVGSVLNWYFNRYLEDNLREYQSFESIHSDIVPNAHVRRLMLNALQKRHGDGETMSQKIELRNARKQMLSVITGDMANKIYLDLEKYFDDFDCLYFSENISCANPNLLKWTIAKFRHENCGITPYNGMFLVTDLAGQGEMRKIFAKFLEMATPASWGFNEKGMGGFFLPFEAVIKNNIRIKFTEDGHLLAEIEKNPHKAAGRALSAQIGRGNNMWSRYATHIFSQRFDEYYASRNPSIS